MILQIIFVSHSEKKKHPQKHLITHFPISKSLGSRGLQSVPHGALPGACSSCRDVEDRVPLGVL